MLLVLHLRENALGDIVVAAPVGGALGEGELIEIMAAGFIGDPLRRLIDLAGALDQMALAAEALVADEPWPDELQAVEVTPDQLSPSRIA